MKTITEGQPDFKTFEKTLFEAMCRIAREMARQYLEWRDVMIMGQRDTREYRLIGIRGTTVKTVFGEVAYSRRYYRRGGGGHVFLLDEEMGIFSGFGLVSGRLAERVVDESADKSFRKAAASISALTGQGISAMGAWNVVQRYGKAAEEQEARLTELYEGGSVGHLGGIPTRVLFDEYDDVWIPRQREKRRKPGTAAKGAKKIGRSLGKQPMRIGIAYTGWGQPEEGRRNTADKIAYASFSSAPDFLTRFETLLNHRFDMGGVERRITNGDGAPWIRAAAEENGSILQLDAFHRNQAIMKAVRDKGDRRSLFSAIGEKDVGGVLASICEMAMDAPDETARGRLSALYAYFRNNEDSLLTWQERGVELPAPPEGISYHGMGVQESSNCLITQRMKHRRGSWSEGGANNMARILCFRGTIGLDAILGVLPEPEPIGAFAEPLSAAKAPSHDGKGYGADWLYAPMPFEGAFRTHGREAIRAMLRMKPLPSLPFLQGGGATSPSR